MRLAIFGLMFAGAASAAPPDLLVETFQVESIRIYSGKYAAAEGFSVKSEGDGRSVTVPYLKDVKLTVEGKPATRGQILEWVSSQRKPMVTATTSARRYGAAVELNFYAGAVQKKARTKAYRNSKSGKVCPEGNPLCGCVQSGEKFEGHDCDCKNCARWCFPIPAGG